jgi:hypothetical protein
MPPGGPWHQLQIFLENAPRHAALAMKRPVFSGPPSPEQALILRQKARYCGLSKPLELHLLAAALLNPSGSTINHPWPSPQLEDFLPTDQNSLQSTPWICFPVPMVQGTIATTVFGLLGASASTKGATTLHAPQLSMRSRDAVRRALCALARVRGVVPTEVIAIFLFDETTAALTGSSLALPIALALDLLQRGQAWPDLLLATGGVGLDGTLEKVSGIADKCTLIPPHGCLITPENNIGDDYGQNLVCCTNLEQALEAVTLYHLTTDPSSIRRLQHHCAGPKEFLHHFASIPAEYLGAERCRALLSTIRKEPRRWLRNAVTALQLCIDDVSRARHLAHLYSPEELEKLLDLQLGNKEGLAVGILHDIFSWIITVISHANRLGDIEETYRWQSLQLLTEQYLREDDAYLCCLNHRFVGERFNRYRFSPEIPDDIRTLLQEEESRNAASFRANFHLGAMYGTLAQNCGFCGPSQLEELERYVTLAKGAFGRKYRHERKRLLLYRVYAWLDVGDVERATEFLGRYLDVPEKNDADRWCQALRRIAAADDPSFPYAAAATLRLFVGSSHHTCLQQCQEMLQWLTPIWSKNTHPWQLISINLGRLFGAMGDVGQASALFARSMAICQSGGTTMKPMALLALANAHRLGVATTEQYRQGQDILDSLRNGNVLCRDHFRGLVDCGGLFAAIEYLGINQEKFFPFMYR